MKRKQKIERIEVKMEDMEKLLARAKTQLSEEDFDTLQKVVDSFSYVTELLENKKTTIDHLRKLLFGSTSEKTDKVFEKESKEKKQKDATGKKARKKKRKGHGRNGAAAYRGAKKTKVPHESLKPGDPCPECKNGKVYRQSEPGVIVRLKGQAPLQATVYELEKLRCNLCGKIFTAQAPDGVGEEKYDETTASMIALLKYGSGLPFNRLEMLEGNLGIPLPASTQWEIVEQSAKAIDVVFEELIRQAAQGEVVHNDDTGMKILAFMGEEAASSPSAQASPKRKGVFTTGIVSIEGGRRIALFFTGHRHAGENLADVLKNRAAKLDSPIQMCDALSRNMPGELETIVANCLAHGRRRFVDVAVNFPDECLLVLNVLKDVYKNDAVARNDGMSPEERLRFHQTESSPRMRVLETWMAAQIEEKKVEPNSGLGEAIAYMQNHWEKLTLFLREPRAPIDNNICERMLKKAILHRKNSYFYKTENGARVGDLFMSLICTCELNGVNPFDYLTELQKHAKVLSSSPEVWMPWNYRDTLAGSSPSCRD